MRRGLTMIAALLAASATPALAETAAQRAACIGSVFELCPAAAAAGDREAAKACLLKNIARASPRCQAVVRATTPASVAAAPKHS